MYAMDVQFHITSDNLSFGNNLTMSHTYVPMGNRTFASRISVNAFQIPKAYGCRYITRSLKLRYIVRYIE